MNYEPHLAFFREAFSQYTEEDREYLKKVVKVPSHLGPMNLGPIWFFTTVEGVQFMMERFTYPEGVIYYIGKDATTGKLAMTRKFISLGECFKPKEQI